MVSVTVHKMKANVQVLSSKHKLYCGRTSVKQDLQESVRCVLRLCKIAIT